MDSGASPVSGHRRGDPSDESSSPMDAADLMFAKRGCCSFWIPCFGSNNEASGPSSSPSVWWERIRTAEMSGCGGVGGGGGEGRWWSKALMKVREWSEIVAGPRWKTFIRRFRRHNNNPTTRWGGGGTGRFGGKFQYDPLSYSLNFDEGKNGGPQSDADLVYRDFSSRFAAPPISAKSSMDLGGRDSPPIFAAA